MLFPVSAREISLFWHITHFNGQPEKNTAPVPFLPEMQGSSHLWSITLATFISLLHEQNPGMVSLSAPHFRGHSIHFIVYSLKAAPFRERLFSYFELDNNQSYTSLFEYAFSQLLC